MFGFSLDFYGGFPILQLYPPGYYYIAGILTFFGIDILISLRIFLFLSIFFLICLPYYICKKIGLRSVYGFFASLLFILRADGQIWLSFCEEGTFTYVLTLVLGIVLLVRNLDFILKRSDTDFREKDQKKLELKFYFFNTILLCLIILLDFYIILEVAIYIGEIILVKLLISKNKKVLITDLMDQIKYIIPSFLILGFWLIPSIFLYLPQTKSISGIYVFSLELSRMIWGLLWHQIVFIILFLVMLIVIILRPNKLSKRGINFSEVEKFIAIIVLTSLFFSTIVPEFRIEIFLGNYSIRKFMIFEIFSPVIFFIFINKLLKFTARNAKLIKHSTKTVRNSDALVIPARKSLMVASVIISVIIISFIFRYDDSQIWGNDTISRSIIYNGNPEEFISIKPDVESTFNWIKENSSEDSRILIEDSGSYSGVKWGGLLLSYGPTYTNRSFIGGFVEHYWYKYGDNSTCKEGKAFGVPFVDMDVGFFISKLNFFNIRNMIVWSEEAKDFFNSYPLNFTYIISYGEFFVYNFTTYNGSYVHINRESLAYELRTYKPDEILINVENPRINDTITISVHNFYNWNLMVSGIKDVKDSQQEFLTYTFKQNYDGIIEIRFYWRVSFIEKVSIYISVLSIIGICSAVILAHRKYQENKINSLS